MRLVKRIAASVSVAAMAALLAGTSASAVELAGFKVDDTARLSNQDLKLNGAGIRYKAIFKVYGTALYLPKKANTVSKVLDESGPKRVTLIMMRTISNDAFGQAFMEAIHENTEKAERAKFVTQLLKFGEMFASVPELKSGDIINIDWIPGTGTVLQLNGRRLIEPLPDIAFYNALLKIWLGDHPADSHLKPLLLGERADSGRSNNNF